MNAPNPSGTGSDYTALKNALTSAGQNHQELVLASGATYLTDKYIDISGLSNWAVDFNGATIKVMDGVDALTSGYGAMQLTNCSRYRFKNGFINGNRANRNPSGEHDVHNFNILGGFEFVYENMISKNSCADGWYIIEGIKGDGTTCPHDWLLLNCEADNNWRQGLSIINSKFAGVWGGDYHHTNGTAPQAGIDIEANDNSADYTNQNIWLEDISLYNNAGFGLLTVARKHASGLSATNLEIYACTGGAISNSMRDAHFDGLDIHDFTSLPSGSSLIHFPSPSVANWSSDCSIRNGSIYNVGNITGSSRYGLYQHGAAGLYLLVENLRISGLNVPTLWLRQDYCDIHHLTLEDCGSDGVHFVSSSFSKVRNSAFTRVHGYSIYTDAASNDDEFFSNDLLDCNNTTPANGTMNLNGLRASYYNNTMRLIANPDPTHPAIVNNGTFGVNTPNTIEGYAN